jgi:hypothetical protein
MRYLLTPLTQSAGVRTRDLSFAIVFHAGRTRAMAPLGRQRPAPGVAYERLSGQLRDAGAAQGLRYMMLRYFRGQ